MTHQYNECNELVIILLHHGSYQFSIQEQYKQYIHISSTMANYFLDNYRK